LAQICAFKGACKLLRASDWSRKANPATRNRSGLAGGRNYGPRGAMRDHGQLSLTVTRIPN
jgi:hypothetical protein